MNSREIKFRTFFHEEGVPPQMIYFHLDDFVRDDKSLIVGQVFLSSKYQKGYEVEYCTVEQPFNALPDQLTELSDITWGADNSPLMQFTGLKDKKGREIYEGDVVKDNNGQTYEIIYSSDGKFDLQVYGANILSSGSYFTQIYESKYLEIVGNKFENPELLAE